MLAALSGLLVRLLILLIRLRLAALLAALIWVVLSHSDLQFL